MSPSLRFLLLPAVLVALVVSGYGQNAPTDPEAAAAVSNGQAGLSSRVTPVDVTQTQPTQLTVGANTVFDAETGAVVGGGGGQASINTAAGRSQTGNDDNLLNVDIRHTPAGGTIDGLDTGATFDGAFASQAGARPGGRVRFSMVGEHSFAHPS